MSTVVDLAALGTRGFIIQGDAELDLAGYSVRGAGDVNGDGFDDVIIGAPGNDAGGNNAGKSYVVFGSAGGFGTVDLGNLQPDRGFAIQGDVALDRAGVSVSGAGDVNGDGFDDIVVSSNQYDFYYGGSSAAYVIFGREHFTTVDLTNLAMPNGFVIDGGNSFQLSVGAAGDVNHDGFDDIVIGKLGSGPSGNSYVIYGKAGGFGPIDVAALSASDGFLISGATTHDFAGFSVAGAGDVNGDGFDDIILGAPLADIGQTDTGQAYVIFGRPSGGGTIDLANLAPSAGFMIQAHRAFAQVGSSVSGAGDVNGDGFDDVIVGGPFADAANAGESYVIFGRAGGFGTIDLTNLSPAAGFVILGDAASDISGGSVAGAGDVNRDGFDDLIVGAIHGDDGGVDAGEAYVIFGRSAFGTIHLSNLAPDAGFILQGAAPGDGAGFSVAGAGDINGDGFADIIVGAPYGDLGGNSAGQAYVVSGTATLDAPRNDFNHDGFSDVLWRSDDGRVETFLGQPNGSFVGHAVATPALGASWQVDGTGDFNGDGVADILWRNANGQTTDWLGDGNGGFTDNSPVFSLNPGLDWHVAGTGDFNGDGRDDILWRNDAGNVVTLLGAPNGSFIGNVAFQLNPGLDWHIEGTGDFNGDSRDDILWRNDAGNVVTLLGASNGSFVGNVNLGLNPGLNWHIVGTGDFNGDGHDDILWRNDAGAVTDYLGQANGTFVSNLANLNMNPGANWHIEGIGDFNGDTFDDVILRDNLDNTIDWLGQANGGFVDNGVVFHLNPGIDWHIEDRLVHDPFA